MAEDEPVDIFRQSLKKYSQIGNHDGIPDDVADALCSLETIRKLEKEKMARYEVHTFTSDRRFAGTDAAVTIVLLGNRGTSATYTLGGKKKNFERGRMDVFKLDAENVGSLQSVEVGQNNRGVSSDWHLDKIVIKKYLNQREQDERLSALREDPQCPEGVFHEDGLPAKLPYTDRFHFQCDAWLNKQHSVRNLVCSGKETDFVETHLPGAVREEHVVLRSDERGLDPLVIPKLLPVPDDIPKVPNSPGPLPPKVEDA